MGLAENLKIAREFLGKSQKEMAKAVGASLTAWQNYESGSQVPGGKVFEALARMGFNINWLLTGEGEMKQGEEARPVFTKEQQPAYSPPLKVNNDTDLAEIVDILKHDLPEAKKFILKVLRGRKETKEGLEGLGLKLKEEG